MSNILQKFSLHHQGMVMKLKEMENSDKGFFISLSVVYFMMVLVSEIYSIKWFKWCEDR
jgi:hypothetical protein